MGHRMSLAPRHRFAHSRESFALNDCRPWVSDCVPSEPIAGASVSHNPMVATKAVTYPKGKIPSFVDDSSEDHQHPSANKEHRPCRHHFNEVTHKASLSPLGVRTANDSRWDFVLAAMLSSS